MDLKQRIRRDTQLVAGDDEAAALLAWLVEHLFNPNLDATFLARESGASREVRGRLAAKVGSLKAYIQELRMLEAARLMRDTDLSVADVAKRLGIRSVRTFHRIFGQYHGKSPSGMRKQARAEATPDAVQATEKALAGLSDDGDGSAPARSPTPRARAARLRRRMALGLETENAGELRQGLWQKHPDLETATADEGSDAARLNATPANAARAGAARPRSGSAPRRRRPTGAADGRRAGARSPRRQRDLRHDHRVARGRLAPGDA